MRRQLLSYSSEFSQFEYSTTETFGLKVFPLVVRLKRTNERCYGKFGSGNWICKLELNLL